MNSLANLQFQSHLTIFLTCSVTTTFNGTLVNFNNSFLECSMSQDSNYCQFYDIGDTIHNDDLWLKKDRIRLSMASGTTCPPICPERRDTINAYLNDRYIGLRIANEIDTAYYWYRLDIEEFHYLTLKEFGRKRY